MLRSNYLTNKIDDFLIKKEEENKKNHISSGKLSASMLWQPLQWQILKVLKIPSVEVDAQGYRNMYRGKKIEDDIIGFLGDSVVEKQKFVEYRNTVGYIDVMIDINKWASQGNLFKKDLGIIPFEIKTVTRDKFARINKTVQPDKSYILQACFYAMAENKDNFGLICVNSSDYRDITWIFETADYKNEIDGIIDKFYETLNSKKIPVFEAKEKWQENIIYNQYPEWSKLNEKEIEDKLRVDYPDSYKILQEYKN